MINSANETLIRDAYAAYAGGEIDKLLDLVDPEPGVDPPRSWPG
jgi:hypothetical protein